MRRQQKLTALARASLQGLNHPQRSGAASHGKRRASSAPWAAASVWTSSVPVWVSIIVGSQEPTSGGKWLASRVCSDSLGSHRSESA